LAHIHILGQNQVLSLGIDSERLEPYIFELN